MKSTMTYRTGLAGLITACALSTPAFAAGDFNVSTKGGLKVANNDGSASVQVGGRIQWDYDRNEVDVQGGPNAVDEEFEIRRARLYVKGKVQDWGYKAQFNVAEAAGKSNGTVEDLYVTYAGFGKLAKITIGKHKEAFGLEQMTSSKNIAILERSAATEVFTPGRNAGVTVSGSGKQFTYAAGLFREESSNVNTGDFAVTARGTFAPIQTKDGTLLHLGAATRISESAKTIGLEVAGAVAGFHGQAEYFVTNADGSDSASDDSYYVQGGYVFNGNRAYKGGKFKGVKPNKGDTAIEVVARYENGVGKYSDTGLDKNTIGTETAEGTQSSVAVNFYPISNIRFGVSYMTAELDSGAEANEYRVRTQFTF